VKSSSLRILAVAAVAAALVFGARAATAAGGKKKAAVRGQVTSVDQTAKSFVVKNKKAGDVTVVTDAKTVFKKADGSTGAFADVLVKSRVMVQGGPVADGKVNATEVDVQAKKPKKAATAAPAAAPAAK